MVYGTLVTPVILCMRPLDSQVGVGMCGTHGAPYLAVIGMRGVIEIKIRGKSCHGILEVVRQLSSKPCELGCRTIGLNPEMHWCMALTTLLATCSILGECLLQ